MSSITIRDMTVEDIGAVIQLGGQFSELLASEKDEFWDEETLRGWVEAGQDIMLVAESGGRVAGFHLTQLHLPSRSGYLSDIAVDPSFRRQGIASRLLDETLSRMKRQGITYVYGLTKVNNQKIHAVMRKNGFYQGDAFYWFDKRLG